MLMSLFKNIIALKVFVVNCLKGVFNTYAPILGRETAAAVNQEHGLPVGT